MKRREQDAPVARGRALPSGVWWHVPPAPTGEHGILCALPECAPACLLELRAWSHFHRGERGPAVLEAFQLALRSTETAALLYGYARAVSEAGKDRAEATRALDRALALQPDAQLANKIHELGAKLRKKRSAGVQR